MARLQIAEIARERGFTQKRLAEESHNAPGTINRYWNNYGKQVNLDTLEGIARALGVNVHDLIVDNLPGASNYRPGQPNPTKNAA